MPIQVKQIGISVCVAALVAAASFADIDQPLQDGDFELQRSRTISPPWGTEGPGLKGIDIGLGNSYSGRNNAFIRTSDRQWNAITQFIATKPLQQYGVQAYIRSSNNIRDGYFGVRDEVGRVIEQKKFGPVTGYTRIQFVFKALPRQTGVNLFIGYWGAGQDGWIQIDQVHVGKMIPYDDQ